MMTTDTSDDLLWQQLKTLPAFRALLRAVEARFYEQIPLPRHKCAGSHEKDAPQR